MNLPLDSVDQPKKTKKTSDFSSKSSTSRRDLHQIPGDFFGSPTYWQQPCRLQSALSAQQTWPGEMARSVPLGQCSVLKSSDLQWPMGKPTKNMWNSWKKKLKLRVGKKIDKMLGFFTSMLVKKIKELTMKLLVECRFLSEDVHFLEGQHSSLSDVILVFPCYQLPHGSSKASYCKASGKKVAGTHRIGWFKSKMTEIATETMQHGLF